MYAVISDVHLGNITDMQRELFLQQLKVLRSEKLNIIWLGDTFDLIWDKNSFLSYKYILQDNDIVLTGNHDFELPSTIPQKRYLWVGNSFLTHGDLVDFGYFTARMEHFRHHFSKFPPDVNVLEVIAYLLYRNWKFEDVFTIYELMEHLPEQVLRIFSHDQSKPKPNKLKQIILLLNVLKKARKYLSKTKLSRKSLYPKHATLPKPKNGALFGYFTDSADELLKRTFLMYMLALAENPKVKNIFIGHIHKPVKTKNRGVNFSVVGSWKSVPEKQVYPTVPIIDGNGNIIEYREFQ